MSMVHTDESRKQELRETSRKEAAQRLFAETYEALLTTLRDTYPECKDLSSPESSISHQWFTEFQGSVDKVHAKDESLMLVNIPVLTALQIPQLWVQGKFTPTSKTYMWMYLINLMNFATSAHASAMAQSTPTDCKDIDPPASLPLPGIQKIYDELPKNMMDKVKTIAEKYSQQIEEGEASVDSLQFNEISKELFAQIDPDEMQQMVASVGNMLQGVMGDPGSSAGMSELFKAFANKDREF